MAAKKKKPGPTPILDAFMKSGIIWVEGKTEYVGQADDGILVALGSTFDPDQVERYLSKHPSPKDW